MYDFVDVGILSQIYRCDKINGFRGGKRMKRFTLEYWEDEGWYVGRLVEIPGVFSQGETLEDLKENIQDAYEMMLKSEPSAIVPTSAQGTALEMRP